MDNVKVGYPSLYFTYRSNMIILQLNNNVEGEPDKFFYKEEEELDLDMINYNDELIFHFQNYSFDTILYANNIFAKYHNEKKKFTIYKNNYKKSNVKRKILGYSYRDRDARYVYYEYKDGNIVAEYEDSQDLFYDNCGHAIVPIKLYKNNKLILEVEFNKYYMQYCEDPSGNCLFEYIDKITIYDLEVKRVEYLASSCHYGVKYNYKGKDEKFIITNVFDERL